MSIVSISREPWILAEVDPREIALVAVPPPVVHALGAEDNELADSLSTNDLSPYVVGKDCRSLWRMRSQQITADPTSAAWITRLITVSSIDEPTVVVGLAGFHGPPDERGMVEVGYRVDPLHRRQGYARSALEILLNQAAENVDVHIVRATISPTNESSRALIDQYGFLEVGEQWDDEDGLEIIFERTAR